MYYSNLIHLFLFTPLSLHPAPPTPTNSLEHEVGELEIEHEGSGEERNLAGQFGVPALLRYLTLIPLPDEPITVPYDEIHV